MTVAAAVAAVATAGPEGKHGSYFDADEEYHRRETIAAAAAVAAACHRRETSVAAPAFCLKNKGYPDCYCPFSTRPTTPVTKAEFTLPNSWPIVYLLHKAKKRISSSISAL